MYVGIVCDPISPMIRKIEKRMIFLIVAACLWFIVSCQMGRGRLFALKCNYVFYEVCMREHIYRTYGCDDVVLAEDFEVARL